MTHFETQLDNTPRTHQDKFPNNTSRSTLADRKGFDPQRTQRGKHSTASIARHTSPVKHVEANSDAGPEGDVDEVGHPTVLTSSFPQMSLSGIVDAILGIGNQRKALLGQLRSALVSNSDSEALGYARQLCGLTA